ncbi:MAG: transglutaminase-like domain-containing protein [Betaproteobacteria bacterium]
MDNTLDCAGEAMTIGIAANLLAVAGIIAYVLWRAHPVTEAVRMRNALLLASGRPEDFDWAPPQFPAGFKAERLPATPEFREIVAALKLDDLSGDWDKALALATHLIKRVEYLGPVRADLLTTYRAIQNGYGYCADFVKIYLALAHTAGLTARQWAFSFDGFGGHGHTVVEVYDRQRGKWLFLDVFNNFHVIDPESGEPIGVLECREALLASLDAVCMRPNGPGRQGFVHREKALEYYHRGVHQWYLLGGNAVFSYYAHPLVGAAGRVSKVLGQIAASIIGVTPGIRIYETPENVNQVRHLRSLRRQLVILAILTLILLATLAAQLILVGHGVGAPRGSG